MTKATVLALITIFLSACDNQSAPKTTVAEAAKPQQESAKFTCVNGNVSTECNIVAGDQLGSGKWRHAKLNMSGSDASLNIDGEIFYKVDVSSDFLDGSRIVKFELKSAKESRAEIHLESSNAETSLSVNAWNADGKLMLTSSR